jgi:hypothetical protein
MWNQFHYEMKMYLHNIVVKVELFKKMCVYIFCDITRKNLVHSNHMVTTIDATNVQTSYFYNYS